MDISNGQLIAVVFIKLEKNLGAAKQKIAKAELGMPELKDKLITMMESAVSIEAVGSSKLIEVERIRCFISAGVGVRS